MKNDQVEDLAAYLITTLTKLQPSRQDHVCSLLYASAQYTPDVHKMFTE